MNERKVFEVLKYLVEGMNQLSYKSVFSMGLVQDYYRIKSLMIELENEMGEEVVVIPPTPKKRELTPEERKAIGERLRRGKEAKRKKGAKSTSG